MQAEVEARPARVELELEEKITEIKRQQRELQTLRVCKTMSTNALTVMISVVQYISCFVVCTNFWLLYFCITIK